MRIRELLFPLAITVTISACATHEKDENREFVRVQTQTRPHSAVATASEDLRSSTKFATLTENIRFGYASAELTPTSRLALDEIAVEMKKTAHSYGKVRILGFTDSSGHSDRNQKLSQARAEKAKDYLISRGVPAEKIEALGRGPMDSITNGSSTRQARARRVDFQIIE